MTTRQAWTWVKALVIPVAICTIVLWLALAGAAHGTHTHAVAVATKFELAQACRRDLGLPVYQTRRGWETTRPGPYMDWMWRLWHKRHQTCMRQTARATRDVRYAIRLIFRGDGDPRYPYTAAEQAVRVAWCESRWTNTDVTGQYKGVFQLGSSERAQYQVGDYVGVISQVRSGYRMFVAAGRSWSRWQCRPGSGGETSYHLGW